MLYYYALLADQWQKTEGGNFPVNFWKFENTNLQKLTGQNEDEEREARAARRLRSIAAAARVN